MSLSHRYQDFGQAEFDPAVSMPDPDDGLEELKLEAFEDGYKAGWDDSITAQSTDNERAIIQIAQRLEDMSFTHAEAVAKMNIAMQPLLNKIALSLLPDIAKQAVGAHVVEQLGDLLTTHATNAVEIAVAPENLEPLQQLLDGRVSSPITFTAEPALTSGQAYLRAGQAEREINLDAVRDGISAALDAYIAQTNHEEMRHG